MEMRRVRRTLRATSRFLWITESGGGMREIVSAGICDSRPAGARFKTGPE